jgi:Domain of unknown function (DUF4956)
MELQEIFSSAWIGVVWRLILNTLMVTFTGRYIYLKRHRGSREYFFTYISISVIIYIVCILLNQVPVELGMVLGLFAVFSIIRFRSIQATPLELSYLFIAIGFSMLNALIPPEAPFLRILANNLLIIIVIWLADYLLFRRPVVTKLINYDRIDLLAEEKRAALENDIINRFGIRGITKIQVGDIDSLKGKVSLKVTLTDPMNNHFQE